MIKLTIMATFKTKGGCNVLAIGTQNPVLILLQEASLLNLTMNWI